MANEDEKIYIFTKVTKGRIGEIEESEKIAIKESELEGHHINHLLAELIMKYNNYPNKVKLRFLQEIVNQHKTYKNEDSSKKSEN